MSHLYFLLVCLVYFKQICTKIFTKVPKLLFLYLFLFSAYCLVKVSNQHYFDPTLNIFQVLEDSSSIPTALTFRKIRQRCYGVLFNSFQTYSQENTSVKSSKNIIIKEWCAFQGNFMERPECVEPLPLQYCGSLETESKLGKCCPIFLLR